MDVVRISFFSENRAQKLLTEREHTPPDQLWNIVQATNNDFTLLLPAQTLANLVEYVPTSNSTALATSWQLKHMRAIQTKKPRTN